MSDIYIDWIVLLLPLTALMLVRSRNPYQALVIRGIIRGRSPLLSMQSWGRRMWR